MRKWLADIKREVVSSGMLRDNVKELLDCHEWDETMDTRVASLCNLGSGSWPPLIGCQSADGGVFVIDGWHRLGILYSIAPKEQQVIHFKMQFVTLEECKLFPPFPEREGVVYLGVREANRIGIHEVGEEEQDQEKEEGFGGTFGSVVTPSGGALVYNRVQAKEKKFESAEAAEARNQRTEKAGI